MTTKARVLTLLEQNRGREISGASLAKGLGLSRNAVWKAIRELRGQGHDISAAAGRGYVLLETSDILSAEGIRAYLGSGVKEFPIHIYGVLESTNKTAKALALGGAAHGTALLCDSQTAGKGRFGRGFASAAGRGLYMSIVLRPDSLENAPRPAPNPAHVTVRAAVSVCRAIETLTGLSPSIKWVNDILIARKKVCGILTEGVADWESGQIGWMVLGIGVNVSARPEDFPPELRDTAASLYPGGTAPFPRSRLAAEILADVLGGASSWEDTLAGYKRRLCMLGEPIAVLSGETSYPAVALDVDGDGRLVVQKEDGTACVLSSGEISIRRRP